MPHDEYRKDMSHLEWEEVYERQVRRDELAPSWFDALDLGPGDRLLDIGSGPGHIAFLAADVVGPAGTVYAIDRKAAALRYLRHLQTERDVRSIRPVVADAEAMAVRFTDPLPALLTYVLHHADRPPRVLEEVYATLPTGSRVLVAEYHPGGPGEHGPPIDHRIHPDELVDLIRAAGFRAGDRRDYGKESYAVVASKG